jgi:hypothetical protein
LEPSSNHFAAAERPIPRRRDADVMAVLGIAWPSAAEAAKAALAAAE